jgi:DNA-binding beta-propeller fold protein YncE
VNGTITTVAGSANFPPLGDGGPATSAGLSIPEGVAVDSAGNLYIADTGNYRVRKVSGGTITTVAGNGIAGFSGDGAAATNASLGGPQCRRQALVALR